MVKKILSIDGGGTRGIASIQFLSKLELSIDQPLVKTFDLMVGSSVGGLIVGDLIYGSKTANQLVFEKFNRENLSKLFPRLRRNEIFGPVQLEPMYSGDTKRDYILKDISPFTYFTVSDNYGKMAVPVYNVKTGEGEFQRNWVYKSDEHAPFVVDILDQTSAAPGYFPIVTTTSSGVKQRHADGCIFSSNPADFAIIEAMKLWPGEKINLLSIGTGYKNTDHSVSPNDHIGGIQWLVDNHLLESIYESQKQNTNSILSGLANAHPKRYRYLRVDGPITPFPLLDDIDSIDLLRQAGNNWWSIYKERTLDLVKDNT